MLGGLRKGNVPLFLKEMDIILKKNPVLKEKLAELKIFDEYKEIENQYASASTMSDVSPQPKKEMGVPAETLPALAAGAYKVGKPILKGLGKNDICVSFVTSKLFI